MKLPIRNPFTDKHRWITVDTLNDPCYDVNLFNPRPRPHTQEESQMESADRYATFPVGTRVRLTRKEYDGVKGGSLGTVVNHGPAYVHIHFDGQPSERIHPCKTDEIIASSPARQMDANRIYFHYNKKHRSGILNKIELHRNTGNLLMYVREDGTGDLKAFDLSKIGYTGAEFGLDTARQVLVEGMFTREGV